MISISPEQASSKLRALFAEDAPAYVRCCQVLDGTINGQILTDDPANPHWAVAYETAYGTTFLGGSFDAPLVGNVIDQLRSRGEVVLLLLPEDARANLLPTPDYDGFAIDFFDRPVGTGLDAYLRAPEGCEVRRIDHELFDRSVDRDLNIAAFGSVERALENWIGFFLMRGDEILCEASAGPEANGMVELGVATPEPYRRKGYATITCAHLIQTCEGMGYETYWNTAKQNAASVALARKLGYRREVEHRVIAWSTLAR